MEGGDLVVIESDDEMAIFDIYKSLFLLFILEPPKVWIGAKKNR